MRKTIEERFWKRIVKSRTCWEWQGAADFYIKNNRTTPAKYSYKLHFGTIPNKMFVQRSCKNYKCVNPKHLFLSKKSCEHKIYDYNLDTFYNENDISYYLLGAYMTDGDVHLENGVVTAIRLSSKDTDWLMSIKNLICKETKITNCSDTDCRTFGIYSKELGEWLLSKGCTPKKSLTLKFPSVPDKYLPDFIRGCIDGDGSVMFGIYKQQQCYRYDVMLCGASKQFFEKFNLILDKNNFNYSFETITNSKPSITKHGKLIIQKHPCYKTKLSGSNAYNFLQWIYYPNHRLSMKRKFHIANKIIEAYPIHKSKSLSKPNRDKLSFNKAKEIRKLYNTGNYSYEQIAKKYGVVFSTISAIVKNKIWKF